MGENVVNDVPILLYHSVADDPPAGFARWAIEPDLFDAHLEYLATNGYVGLTVSDYVRILAARGALPERPVLITFDDGFRDVLSTAAPSLERYGFNATLYVTTGYIGGRSSWLTSERATEQVMVDRSDLLVLRDRGFEIGSHAVTHRPLDELPLTVARQEIVASKVQLEEVLGAEVSSFAYPHGYSSPAIRRAVREAGYASACGVTHALSGAGDDPYALVRLIVDRGTTVADLMRLLLGEGAKRRLARERMATKGWRWARRSRAALAGTHR
jgi:peptidoglycan/xylan/chitin deacetylase (PgdA/CDA1 family)